jgi:isoamylase
MTTDATTVGPAPAVTHHRRVGRVAASRVEAGSPLPLGAHQRGNGFNFAVFSRHATRILLLLFARPDDDAPCATIPLDPRHHRTGDIWHAWVGGLRWGQAYAFRAEGPFRPEEGHRFDSRRLLLDPYAHALAETRRWDFARARGADPGSPDQDLVSGAHDDARWTARCLLIDGHFDWQDDRPPRTPWSDTVIYETHVRGLTRHPSSRVRHRGTFLGLVEKIPYLKELGVTAVELMPVQEFNERELLNRDPLTGATLVNYWGYSTLSFFAPKEGYASGHAPGAQVREFKTMVRELHRARIEVILDVVFNHTAEGNETGPTLNFRGLDNSLYYLLEEDRRFYKNYSGCGNTLNCHHPVVQDYILDCLRYWVMEMRVDGFRFDLASVLARNQRGELLPDPPLLERIAEDPILRDVKLIAEAWDAAGAYQVGSFPGTRWSEWNAHFRDDVRRFWRGDPGMTGALATRLCGSADLYQHNNEQPINSINFVTCHDGFTLNDLVSYRTKRNERNGEANRDGLDENFAESYGPEGETTDPEIDRVRLRQIKNMLATLLVSRGVPMLLGGDEFRRTQGGNNNAYCQDNVVSWYDWRLLDRNRELFRFVRGLLALRRRHPVLRAEEFYTDEDLRWFGPDGGPPDWHGPENRLGCVILSQAAGASAGSRDPTLCLLLNASPTPTRFAVPAPPGRGQRWRVAVDTAAPPPGDVCDPESETPLDRQHECRLPPRAMAILVAR